MNLAQQQTLPILMNAPAPTIQIPYEYQNLVTDMGSSVR